MSSQSHSTPVSGSDSIGVLLQHAWRLCVASGPGCAPLALLAVCAGGAPQAFALATGQSRDLGWWLMYAASTLLALLCYGAIILRQRGVLAGTQPSLLSAVRRSAQRLPATLAVLLPGLPVVLLGFVLLLLPGMIAALWLLLAWLLLLESGGPRSALRRSAQLLRPRLWRVLGACAVAAAGTLVFVILAGVFVGVVMVTAQAGGGSGGPQTRALGTVVLSLILVPPVLYLCALLVAVHASSTRAFTAQPLAT